jgi:hypothetical protein
MRTHPITLLTALLALSGRAVQATAQANGTPDEQAVIAAENARRDALLKADTVSLSKLVATEFVEISRIGTLRTRSENLQEIATGDLKLQAIRYDNLSARVYGEVAILTGVAENAGSFHGTPFAGRVRYSRVFVRREGRWQAVLMQQTAMP